MWPGLGAFIKYPLFLLSLTFKCNYFLFQIEGEVEKDSEVRATYKDLHAKRPICQKLTDHTEEIQPRREMEETSEYRDTLNKIEVRNTIKHHTSLFDKIILFFRA